MVTTCGMMSRPAIILSWSKVTSKPAVEICFMFSGSMAHLPSFLTSL